MINETYLEKLVEKSNNKISKEFGFSRIDAANIFLVKQVLEKEDNLWFEVDNQHLGQFYQVLVFASAVYFFESNYCESRKIKPKIGDKYKKGKICWKVIEVDCAIEMNGRENATKLECISKKNKDSTIITVSMDEYIKLKPTTPASSRDTFKPMLDFLDRTLGEKENIPSFPHKFAIVAQKNEFESCFQALDKKAFPYVYIADSGQETENIPSADALFFVASSYEAIQKYLFDKEIKLEVIIFIGNKYSYQIQQDIDRDYFRSAIFIGEKNPEVKCLKWRWTLPEYQYFDVLTPSEIEITKIENTIISQLIDKFVADIKQLEQENKISLRARILPYIDYIYPLVVLAEDSRLKNRVDDLLYSFEKKTQSVLGEEFSNIDKDSADACGSVIDNYKAILQQLYFANNAKTYALQQANQTDYLLVPERQTLYVWKQELKKLNWQEVKVISYSKLKTLSKRSSVTILSLQDYDFYRTIRESKHTINWLLYDGEYQRYKNFIVSYDNELIEEYKSKDRKKLTAIDYPDKIKSESIDDVVDRFWSNGTNKCRYATTYQDHIDKAITFNDGHQIKLSANSTLILLDQQNKPRKYKASDLSIGDKIRVYENQHKDMLFNSINSDEDSKCIILHSKLWKQKLEKYCRQDRTKKINEVANLCAVAPATVEVWLKKSNTKFPKNIEPLKNILGNKYQAIYASNKSYNSIMIALGRDLSDEVADFIMNDQKGKLLQQFDDNMIAAIAEHNMPVRVITKISLVDKQV